MLDSKLSSASDAADENASSGVAFGPWGMSTGLVQSGVFVAKHVYLNMCDSDYDLAVMVTLALAWVGIGIGSRGTWFGPDAFLDVVSYVVVLGRSDA